MDKLLVLGSISLSGTLLAGVTALICRMLRGRVSARSVYVLWLLVLLRFLCPWTTPHSLMTQAAPLSQEQWVVEVPEPHGSQVAPAVRQAPPPIAPETVLCAVWLTGAAGVAAVRAISYARFAKKIRRTSRLASPSAQRVYAALTARYRRPPGLVCSPAAATPMLMGWVHPRIVLPCLELEEEALELLLSHELTHWRRHDIPVKWISVSVTVLHWFNPTAWWLLGRLDRAGELSCDETLAKSWDRARRVRYGQLLLALCAVPAPRFAVSCLSKKQRMKERLVHLMDLKRKPFAGVLAAGACAAVLLTSVALGAYAAPEPDTISDPEVSNSQGETALQWPLKVQGSVMLSGVFGSRVHPVTGKTTDHSGIDIVLDAGTPVLAAVAGTVAETDFDPTDGRYIVLNHGSLTTKYCHLSDIRVEPGETVAAGQEIGAAGQTGMSTGTCLHFETAKDGSLVDPLSLLPQTQTEYFH